MFLVTLLATAIARAVASILDTAKQIVNTYLCLYLGLRYGNTMCVSTCWVDVLLSTCLVNIEQYQGVDFLEFGRLLGRLLLFNYMYYMYLGGK